MIELTVLRHLSDSLEVPVYMEIPAEPVKEYVVVEKTGSSNQDFIFGATIVVQSIAPTLYEAAKLNETVKTAMETLETVKDVAACKLNTDCNFSDPRLPRYRYQAVFNIVHY